MDENAWYWADFGEIDGVKVVGGAGNQLISSDWIREATKVQVPSTMALGTPLSIIDGIGVYGLNGLVNGVRPNGNLLWPDVPKCAYAASGYNNNKMFIIPEWDMVVVRLGLDEIDG